MKLIEVKSFNKLLEHLEGLDCYNGWIFRGQADVSWPLQPKVGRSKRLLNGESMLLQAWKRDAREYVDHSNFLDDWEWLALGQHHGLATRFLDWSRDPLSALFFALAEDIERDSTVYAFRHGDKTLGYSNATEHPFSVEGIGYYRPGVVTNRISRQKGVFTVHGPPDLDLRQKSPDGSELITIMISAAMRSPFRSSLTRLGVDRSSLFPDLDGLATHLNWLTEKMKTKGSASSPNVTYAEVEKRVHASLVGGIRGGTEKE